MFELFKLVGRVMVDASGANQALDGTDKKAKDVTNGLGGYMDKLKGWAQAAGAAIAGSAIVKGLKEVWDISSQVAEAGDNIDKASQKFLMSTDAYQRWDYIAQRSGTTIEAVGNAVYELSKKVGEGNDETLALLEEIGISAADAMTATPEELFEQVIDGLRGVDDITRRTYIADTLLSGSAKDITTIFNTNKDAAKELDDRYKELGGTMSDELVAMSSKYMDAQTDLQEAWDGVKNHLEEKTLPGMTQIVDGLTQMLTGDFKKGLETAADGVVDYITALLDSFSNFASGVRDAIESALDVDLGVLENNPIFGTWTPNSQAEREQQISEGLEQWISDTEAAGGVFPATQDYLSGAFGKWKSWRNKTFGMGGYTDKSGKFANGLDFVPRDDYPARLHYGEQVLTKQEADDYRAGKTNGGNITINITTTQQSPAQTAAAVAAALTRARWAM